MKRFAALLLAGLMSCAAAIPSLAVETNGDDWAIPSLEFAYEEGLLTEVELQKAKSPMSRLEFCKVVMRFLNTVTGESREATQESPFADCDDPDVIAAYEAGIIGGVEPGVFAPDRTITREQMSIMLARVLKQCGIALPSADAEKPFSDIAALYASSAQYIAQLYAAKIISGYDDGTYGPFRQMTVQEAAISFVKAYRYALQNAEQTPSQNTEPAQPAEKPKDEQNTSSDRQNTFAEMGNPSALTVAGKTLTLGMSVKQLIALCGAPSRIDNSVYAKSRYIYVNDYKNYFFVTFDQGKAVEIFVPGQNFSYLDINGDGTSADIGNSTYLSAVEHSVVIAGEDAEARIPLDYEGSISGILLQTAAFVKEKDPSSSILVEQQEALEAEILDLIQVKRVQRGIAPLTLDKKLSATAGAHSQDMMDNKFFAYNSKDGTSPFLRILREGKVFSTASEVISKQRGDVVNIYQDWIRTPSKISALTDSTMEEVGVGVTSKTKELYVTVDLCGHGI